MMQPRPRKAKNPRAMPFPRPRKAKNHLQIVKNHLFLSKIIHEMPLHFPIV